MKVGASGLEIAAGTQERISRLAEAGLSTVWAVLVCHLEAFDMYRL